MKRSAMKAAADHTLAETKCSPGNRQFFVYLPAQREHFVTVHVVTVTAFSSPIETTQGFLPYLHLSVFPVPMPP